MSKKAILGIVFKVADKVVAGYLPVFAVGFSDQRIKRDELIAQRDAMDLHDYRDALKVVLTSAVDKQLTEQVIGRRDTRDHFANLGHSVAQKLFDELITLKETHMEYVSLVDQIVVVDRSRLAYDLRQAFALVGCGATVYVTTKKILSVSFDNVKYGKAAKLIFDYLQEQWPNKTIAIVFNPYFFSSFEALVASFRHELAHLTQSDWQTNISSIDTAIGRWMEIDADIKAMCEQRDRGEWWLSANYNDFIDNLYEGINHDELHSGVIDCLCDGLDENEYKRMSDELKCLDYSHYHSLHPLATNRKEMMRGAAQVIKKIGSLNDSEMEAFTICVTEEHYRRMKQEQGDAFLNKAKQAGKMIDSNPKFKVLADV